MIKLYTLLVLKVLVFSSYIVHSQTADSLVVLPNVTVYSSRLGLDTKQLGRNITIISGKDLSKYPVNSLDDILRFLPSVEVQSRGSFGTQADITMRGSTFNQVLILIDGMRVNDPLTGHFNGYIPITPAEIEQIEVVRGAGSALFGADAVGGIINIITKTFSQNSRPDGYDVKATLAGGEYDLRHLNAGVYLKKQRFQIGGGILINQSAGQLLQLKTPNDQRRSDFSLKTYSLSAAYDFGQLSVSARAAIDDRDFNAQYYYTRSTLDLARETVKRDWYQGQLRYKFNDRHTTELQVARQNNHDYYVFNANIPSILPNSNFSNYTNLQVNHYAKLSDVFKLTLGGQIDRRDLASTDRGDHQTGHWGIYGLSSYRPVPSLNVTGSLRLDNDSSYGTEISPQVNVSYQIGQFATLRGSFGKSIRAADFTERYTSNNLHAPLTPLRNLGNPNLEAERAWNTELGADVQLGKYLVLKATAFNRDATNLIDYVKTNETQIWNNANLKKGSDYFFAQNLAAVQTKGLELELWTKAKLTPKATFEAGVGYTWISSKNSQGIVSQYLTNYAGQLASGTVVLTTPYFNWSVSGLWKSRDAASAAAINRELKTDYQVINTKIDVNVWKQKTYLLVQVQNLFNGDYADLLGVKMPDRWLSVGIRVAFMK